MPCPMILNCHGQLVPKPTPMWQISSNFYHLMALWKINSQNCHQVSLQYLIISLVGSLVFSKIQHIFSFCPNQVPIRNATLKMPRFHFVTKQTSCFFRFGTYYFFIRKIDKLLIFLSLILYLEIVGYPGKQNQQNKPVKENLGT